MVRSASVVNQAMIGIMLLTIGVPSTKTLAIGPSGPFSTQLSSEPGVHLTRYRIAGQSPFSLREFDYFVLKRLPTNPDGEITTDADGNVSLVGELHTKNNMIFRLKSGRLIMGKRGYERLTFTTTTVRGLSYAFSGEYLEVHEQKDDQFVSLKGTMSRFSPHRKIASANVGLYVATRQ